MDRIDRCFAAGEVTTLPAVPRTPEDYRASFPEGGREVVCAGTASPFGSTT